MATRPYHTLCLFKKLLISRKYNAKWSKRIFQPNFRIIAFLVVRIREFLMIIIKNYYELFLRIINPNTFSFLAPLPPIWGRANERFPRVSIRGPLAHQAMTRDAKPTCVAGRPTSWCPFIPTLDDVIGLCVFYRSARLAFYDT